MIMNHDASFDNRRPTNDKCLFRNNENGPQNGNENTDDRHLTNAYNRYSLSIDRSKYVEICYL